MAWYECQQCAQENEQQGFGNVLLCRLWHVLTMLTF
jgi:hypothetical protein